MTDAEIKRMNAEARAAVDHLHELTAGAAVLLLIEQHHDDDGYTIYRMRRGSPYATLQMARIYLEGEQAEGLAGEIGRAISPPDEGDSWKQP